MSWKSSGSTRPSAPAIARGPCVFHAIGQGLEHALGFHGELASLRIGAPLPAHRSILRMLHRYELPPQRQLEAVGRRHAANSGLKRAIMFNETATTEKGEWNGRPNGTPAATVCAG